MHPQPLLSPPSPPPPFPNALLWSDDAPSVICEQKETMLCSSQLLNSPLASSSGTGGGAGGWQSVRSINMKYSDFVYTEHSLLVIYYTSGCFCWTKNPCPLSVSGFFSHNYGRELVTLFRSEYAFAKRLTDLIRILLGRYRKAHWIYCCHKERGSCCEREWVNETVSNVAPQPFSHYPARKSHGLHDKALLGNFLPPKEALVWTWNTWF